MVLALTVALAGSIGACCRYSIDHAISKSHPEFPFGTLFINLSGSLVLGVLYGWFAGFQLTENARVVIGTGFCGGYTTFSTFCLESVRLKHEGGLGRASLNVVATIAGCIAVATLGYLIAR